MVLATSTSVYASIEIRAYQICAVQRMDSIFIYFFCSVRQRQETEMKCW